MLILPPPGGKTGKYEVRKFQLPRDCFPPKNRSDNGRNVPHQLVNVSVCILHTSFFFLAANNRSEESRTTSYFNELKR